MEKLKETFRNHQKTILMSAAVAGTAALGYYGYRRYRLTAKLLSLRDPDFKLQNLPLYHHEAIERDRLLSNVSYDLLLNLSDQIGDSPLFMGRAKIQFHLGTVG